MDQKINERIAILEANKSNLYEQLKELTESEHDYKERIMQVIQDKPKLKNRMVSYAKHKDEESFRAELERIQKKLGLDREIHRQVQL